MRLFAGDDWAEGHHDVEVMDEAGRVLAKRRLPEGVAGIAQLHELIGAHLGEDADEAEVIVGIETDHGPWVTALIAAGYTVFPVNPLQASRYRERHGVSGAKSDSGDAHMLADMVRTDSHQLRPAAGDSPEAEGIKVLARTHKTLIWERTRHLLRLRAGLVEYFSTPFDVGFRKAKELLFESRFISAEEARQLGFVNRVIPPEDLERETLAWAKRISEQGYGTLRLAKLAVNKMHDLVGFSAAMEAAFSDYLVAARMGGHPRKPPEKRRLPGVELAVRGTRGERES
jgi:transposase